MKLIIIFFSLFFNVVFFVKDITDDITAALKKGDSKEIVKHFADKVSVTVISQEDLLSKAQAEGLIEDFFAKHKVKTYQTSHTSTVNGDQQFITGTLDTSAGKYRISFLIRGNMISQFRIENDNG